jgi:Cof subfamily protein (haloacid dehalogenase superfamily)
MGQFEGILLVSDIDGTLLTGCQKIGADTAAAIRRFQAGGGRFTLATGRMASGMACFLENIRLDIPAICGNGTVIHDFGLGATIWHRSLDAGAGEVVDHVAGDFPDSGIEIYGIDSVHLVRANPILQKYIEDDGGSVNKTAMADIPRPWAKAVFVQDAYATAALRSHLLAGAYVGRYQFVRSSDEFYEMLPRGASKGQALLELCRLVGQDPRRTVAVGDNENDLEMIRLAGLGIAVDNAAASLKEQAGHVTVHHEEEAIRQVIEDLESGRLKV